MREPQRTAWRTTRDALPLILSVAAIGLAVFGSEPEIAVAAPAAGQGFASSPMALPDGDTDFAAKPVPRKPAVRRPGAPSAKNASAAKAAKLMPAPSGQQPVPPPPTRSLTDILKLTFRRPPPPMIPADNPFTEAKAELGKTLFFDPRLSRTGTISCSSCHNPANNWSDGRPRGIGVTGEPLPRRSPSLLNASWLTALMWDGRAYSLEQQVTIPLTAEHEMGMPVEGAVAAIAAIPGYQPLFQKAFGSNKVGAKEIQAAIATFERTLVSQDAPFDRWISGDQAAISDTAKKGFEVFNGVARCGKCHRGWRFTDDRFHDIGMTGISDQGRGKLLPTVVAMQNAFKTPSLRDMPPAGPYLHDGSMTTMAQVIEHYEKGGTKRPSLSAEMEPVKLTPEERAALTAFLDTLSGPPLKFEPPVLPSF